MWRGEALHVILQRSLDDSLHKVGIERMCRSSQLGWHCHEEESNDTIGVCGGPVTMPTVLLSPGESSRMKASLPAAACLNWAHGIVQQQLI